MCPREHAFWLIVWCYLPTALVRSFETTNTFRHRQFGSDVLKLEALLYRRAGAGGGVLTCIVINRCLCGFKTGGPCKQFSSACTMLCNTNSTGNGLGKQRPIYIWLTMGELLPSREKSRALYGFRCRGCRTRTSRNRLIEGGTHCRA